MSIILALDLAKSCTGWAIKYDTGRIRSGVAHLARGLGPRDPWLFVRTDGRMCRIAESYEITLIAFEAPIHRMSVAGAEALYGMTAIVQRFAVIMGIEWSRPSNTAIKKHATGRGNADKWAMFKAAQAMFPSQRVFNHNQADALWVLDFVCG